MSDKENGGPVIDSSQEHLPEEDKSVSSSVSGQVAVVVSSDQPVYERRAIRLRCEVCPETEQLLRTATDAFVYHRIEAATQVVQRLALDSRTPHSYLAKAVLALYSLQETDSGQVDQVIDSFRLFDVNKRELMLEVLLILIRNKDLTGAHKFIESNQLLLNSRRLREHQTIDVYMKAYIAFVDYMQWKKRIAESDYSSRHSQEVWAEKTKLSLNNLICENKETILDIFVTILIDMYEHYEQLSEGLQLLTSYVENNPKHLNAYIYLYKWCTKYPNESDVDLKIKALQKVAKLSPENPLVLDLVRNDWIIEEDKFKILMEYIDHKQNHCDIEAWNLIRDLLASVQRKDDSETKIKHLWKQFYEYYWLRVHLNLKTIDPKEFDQNAIEIIECKQKMIEFFYSSSHSFVAQTKQMINEFHKF